MGGDLECVLCGNAGALAQIGAQRDTSEVVTMGEYVVRLPYAIMFQIVPGMSRMFAPYRMASMVVVASVVLVAISLNAIKPKYRRLGASLVLIGVWLQPFYRFDLGPVAEDSDGPAMWRIPLSISTFELPDWYGEVDPEGWEGIIGYLWKSSKIFSVLTKVFINARSIVRGRLNRRYRRLFESRWW